MDHILSLSYGKDSLACLGSIEQLGWPLDRIVHAEVWATDTIPADLPPMVEVKAKADAIIKERWGIEAEHFSAGENYEHHFYRVRGEKSPKNGGSMYGWPMRNAAWCNSDLKMRALRKARAEKGNIIYIGIAADEPNRFHNLSDTKKAHLWKLGGPRMIAAAGARATTFYRPSTPPQPVAAAGFATTRAWDSSGYCVRTTRTCGRLCSNGTRTAQLHSRQTVTPSTTLTGASPPKTKD